MMTNLMTILERKVFISSNPRIVLSSCPPPCGHFSIQESATGGLSYKVKNKYNIEILYLWEDDLYKNEELCKKLIQLYIRNKGILLNYNSFNYHLNEDNTMSINSEIIIPYQNRKVNTYKQFVIQNN